MSIFDEMAREGHEQLIFMQDAESGLRSVIGIHNSTLGPVLGGCRMHDYDTETEVIDDVLRLSVGMTAKSAVTGCNHGGGKAVIWGDPETDKSEALLRAFGRFVQSMRGRFCTGTDMGTTGEDFVVASQESDWMVGLPVYAGGSGDTSVTTAYGVFCGLQAAAAHIWDSGDLHGRRVAVQGLGKVGRRLVQHLLEAGCSVIGTDIDGESVREVQAEMPVEVVEPGEIYDVDCDIFAPCAMGGIVNADTVDRLKCQIIGGAANNQLAYEGVGRMLHEKEILYVPDYIINAGGLIQVADELLGYEPERVRRKTEGLRSLLQRCFELADELDMPPFEAADRLVEERIQKIAQINRIYLV